MSYSLSQLVFELSHHLNGELSELQGNFLMRIPMPDGEIQEVIFIQIENQNKEVILKYFSIAGPVEPTAQLLEFLLRNNLGMDYGGFSLMQLNNAENLVIYESRAMEMAKPAEMVTAVAYVAKLAHEAKKRLRSGLAPL